MNILAIDIGSYSIKFVEVRPERKNLILIEKNEIILDEAKKHYPDAENLNELQKEIDKLDIRPASPTLSTGSPPRPSSSRPR